MSDKRGFQVDAFFIILVLGSVVWAWIGVNTLVDKWDEPFNSVGDFLAGWFAPLAFMWFIYTAIMQKVELNLARNVAEDQAKALDGQLKTQTANHIVEAIRGVTPDLKKNTCVRDDCKEFVDSILRWCKYANFEIDLNIDGEFQRGLYYCFFESGGSPAILRRFLPLTEKTEISYEKFFKVFDAIDQNDMRDNPLVEAFLSENEWDSIQDAWICCRWIRANEKKINEVYALANWSKDELNQYA